MRTRNLIFILIIFVINACSTDASVLPFSRLDADDIFQGVPLKIAKAAGKGDLEKVKKLLNDHKLDPSHSGKHGIPLLYWPLRKANKDGYKLLLKLGASPNAFWGSGKSIIAVSARLKDPFFLDAAIEFGGDVNLKNPRNGETPIYEAVMLGRISNMELLRRGGANLNVVESHSETPMMVAASLNRFDIVYWLLEAGADHTVKDVWEVSVLDMAKDRQLDPHTEMYEWQQKVISHIEAL